MGVGEYDNCHDASYGPRHALPLTTYLYDGCDAATDSSLCQISEAFVPLY